MTDRGETGGAAWRVCWAAALVLATLVVLTIFIRDPGLNANPRASFAAMLEGRADRPFVCRVLVPVTVRLLRSVMPAAVRQMVADVIPGTGLGRFFRELNWEDEYLLEYALALVVMYAALLGYALALRYLCLGVFPGARRVSDTVALLGVLILPAMFGYCSYLYDFPALFLFTVGLALMQRRKWGLFLVCYLAGCLNKETTLLLSMVFLIHFLDRRRMSRALLVRLLVIQVGIFAVVRTGLFIVFRHNAGGPAEFELIRHNLRLLTPYSLPTLFSWLAILFLTSWRWFEKPLFLRQAVWVLVPLLVLTVFFGYLDELRSYYEAVPVMLLLMAHTVAAAFGTDLSESESVEQTGP